VSSVRHMSVSDTNTSNLHKLLLVLSVDVLVLSPVYMLVASELEANLIGTKF